MDTIPDVSARTLVRNPDVRVEMVAGNALLRRRRFGPVRASIARVFRLSPDFTVQLDALGTAAWDLVDGRRKVREIREELQRRFPTEVDLAHRMGRFVGALVSKRMLRLE